jgi:hypothetical protein
MITSVMAAAILVPFEVVFAFPHSLVVALPQKGFSNGRLGIFSGGELG